MTCPTEKEIIDAGRVIDRAEEHFTQLIMDAGFPDGHAFVYASNGEVSISIHAGGKKVFLHPTGKRLYASLHSLSFAQAEHEIAEIKTWKAGKRR